MFANFLADRRLKGLILGLVHPARERRKAAQARLAESFPEWPRSQVARDLVRRLELLMDHSDSKVRGAALVTLEKIRTDPGSELRKAQDLMANGQLECALLAARRAQAAGGLGAESAKLVLQLEHRIGHHKTRSLVRWSQLLQQAMGGPFPGLAKPLVLELSSRTKELQLELKRELGLENQAQYAALEKRFNQLEGLRGRWREQEDSDLARQEALDLLQSWEI